MADVLHGTTQLANWLATVFAPATTGYFRNGLSVANYCTDYSARLPQGAKAVAIPLVAERTADSFTSEGSAVEYTGHSSAESAGTITVNQQKVEVFLFEDLAQLQSSPEVWGTYAEDSAYILRKAFQNYLVDSIITSATTNDVTLGTNNTVTFAKLQEGIGALLTDNVDVSACAFGCNATAWALSTADWGDKYFSVAYTGKETMAKNGMIGQILGIPVIVSGDWSAAAGVTVEAASLWHPRAVGYCIQGGGVRVKIGTQPTKGLADTVGYGLFFGATKLIDAGIANFNQAS
jgi:hypothetical protein